MDAKDYNASHQFFPVFRTTDYTIVTDFERTKYNEVSLFSTADCVFGANSYCDFCFKRM